MFANSCPGRDAARSAASQNRDPGSGRRVITGTPALQRTAPQVLRAALRPGHADIQHVMRGLDPRIHQTSQESFEEDGLPGQARQ